MLDHLKAKPEFPWNQKRRSERVLESLGDLDGCLVVVGESGNIEEVLQPGWEQEMDWRCEWKRWNREQAGKPVVQGSVSQTPAVR